MTKYIYVDVTEFVHWKGNFTGIQRVVYNLTKAIGQTHTVVKPVIYHAGQYSVLNQDMDDLVEHGLHVDSTMTREELVKKKILKKYMKLPSGLRLVSRPAVWIAIKMYHFSIPKVRKLLNIYRIQKAKIKKPKHSVETQETSLPDFRDSFALEDNSYLLIPSSLWTDKGHLAAVLDAKSRGLTLGLVIYDLIPIYYPHTFGDGLLPRYAEFLFETLSVADHIFAISKATAKDVERFISDTSITNRPKIEIIRLGDTLPVKLTTQQNREYIDRFGSLGDFILCVGTIEARKNHFLLYQALKLASETNLLGKLPHILIVGKRGWLSAEVAYFLENDPTISNKVTILDNVADEGLTWLYENAALTVYPSQYEGWGLPVAESLAYGTPVISSGVSSMLEIAPDLVKFISPYNPEELLRAIIELTDGATNRRLRSTIHKKYKLTTWQDTVKPIARTIDQL